MMSTPAPAPSPAPAPAPAVLASSQSTSVDDGLQLRIPVSALTEEFVCTICFGVITDCYMTRCGHNYCHSCIEEWATRSTNCPVCSKPFAASDLIKNSCFDNILQVANPTYHKLEALRINGMADSGGHSTCSHRCSSLTLFALHWSRPARRKSVRSVAKHAKNTLADSQALYEYNVGQHCTISCLTQPLAHAHTAGCGTCRR